MKHASKVQITFNYTDAENTARPGYLAAKFARVKREQREKAEREAAKPSAIVRALKTAKEKA
ncbi:MAG: hypothetical protein NUV63_13900 [Gallionella sp.]|nr:hypothetical protein [Gallionella sp.]